ncbi:UNVERIFIED_CONTAM: hypothetical protein FKN15_068601 [Acipenser sinensis]
MYYYPFNPFQDTGVGKSSIVCRFVQDHFDHNICPTIGEVPVKEAKEYAESIAAIFVETSARNAVNVEELFQKISRLIPPLDTQELENSETFKLTRQPASPSKRCC